MFRWKGFASAAALILLTTLLTMPATAREKAKASRDVWVGATKDNLESACASETQAHAVYAMFALRADEEGYHQIAAMFRAIARGEEVHASLLAGLLGKPCNPLVLTADAGQVGSTRANAESALRDQIYEQAVMYPKYVERAQRDGNKAAMLVFQKIQESEATHRAWYEQILEGMDSYTATGAEFYVCPDCGSVFRSPKPACPCCSSPRDKLERIS